MRQSPFSQPTEPACPEDTASAVLRSSKPQGISPGRHMRAMQAPNGGSCQSPALAPSSVRPPKTPCRPQGPGSTLRPWVCDAETDSKARAGETRKAPARALTSARPAIGEESVLALSLGRPKEHAHARSRLRALGGAFAHAQARAQSQDTGSVPVGSSAIFSDKSFLWSYPCRIRV